MPHSHNQKLIFTLLILIISWTLVLSIGILIFANLNSSSVFINSDDNDSTSALSTNNSSGILGDNHSQGFLCEGSFILSTNSFLDLSPINSPLILLTQNPLKTPLTLSSLKAYLC